MTLKEAILSFYDTGYLLSDGAFDWEPENLLATYESDAPEQLETEVACTFMGIYDLDENGYFNENSLPLYKIESNATIGGKHYNA